MNIAKEVLQKITQLNLRVCVVYNEFDKVYAAQVLKHGELGPRLAYYALDVEEALAGVWNELEKCMKRISDNPQEYL